jgi:hypothetical protein
MEAKSQQLSHFQKNVILQDFVLPVKYREKVVWIVSVTEVVIAYRDQFPAAYIK